jgi:predicted phage terminase large subunit-like protein
LSRRAYLKDLFLFNKEVLKIEAGSDEEGSGRVALGEFHKELCQFVSTEIKKKKLVLMPRGHLKSTVVTVGYSLQRIAQNPKIRILIANAVSTMAEAFLGQIKKHLQYNETFIDYFGAMSLGAFKWSDNMITVNTGEDSFKAKEATVTAYGLGGSLTSQHYDLIIVDDPHNRENINTKDQIDKVKLLYKDLLDLLEPGGQLIIIGCMVGDTKVKMADGTEKNLRDIKVGDKIKTYDNGKLSTSVIKNWANQGRDLVFTITTSSGKIFKANERHPFLIYKNKKPQWIRVRNLNIGQKIVIVKDNGVNGLGKRVSGKDAKSQRFAEGTVPATTIKRSGLMGIAHHLPILEHFVIHTSNIATELQSKITKHLFSNRMANVLFVGGQPVVGGQTKNISVLTTATKQEKSGVCSVMTAIWQWVIQKTRRTLPPSWNTSDFTLDEIVSIKEDGEEEVFDIEVEKTGNFIANGVVSSNTRWHDDDLYGEIIEKTKSNQEYQVFHRQAINGAVIGRKEGGGYIISGGEVLWPAKYSLRHLSELLEDKGLYEWHCQYQNSPTDDENAVFHRSWFKEYDPTDLKGRTLLKFTAIDPAISLKERADYTAIVTIGVDIFNKIYVLEVKRGHWTEKQMADELFFTNEKFRPVEIAIETVAFQKTLQNFIVDETRRKGRKPLPLTEVAPESGESKEKRIRSLQPRYMRGDVLHSKTVAYIDYLEDELLRFPKGKNDDIIDSLAYAVSISRPPRKQNYGEDNEQNRQKSYLY